MEIVLQGGSIPLTNHTYITGTSKKEGCESEMRCSGIPGLQNQKICKIQEKLLKHFEETQNNSNAVSHEILQL
jgi:hypothetical protein